MLVHGLQKQLTGVSRMRGAVILQFRYHRSYDYVVLNTADVQPIYNHTELFHPTPITIEDWLQHIYGQPIQYKSMNIRKIYNIATSTTQEIAEYHTQLFIGFQVNPTTPNEVNVFLTRTMVKHVGMVYAMPIDQKPTLTYILHNLIELLNQPPNATLTIEDRNFIQHFSLLMERRTYTQADKKITIPEIKNILQNIVT